MAAPFLLVLLLVVSGGAAAGGDGEAGLTRLALRGIDDPGLDKMSNKANLSG
ncbi:hypothetical protein TRIUR3_25476 [Triticum urartu]|uniref:Uncharacterized protein n=1 Tax=Triticum urartu TaxID=4572 RepID=M8A670_TRIUA|nr:hypothetical protein TRIUR3_25476 [Triticum urartu]